MQDNKESFVKSFLNSDFAKNSRSRARIPEELLAHKDDMIKLFEMGYSKRSVFEFMVANGLLNSRFKLSTFLTNIRKIWDNSPKKPRMQKKEAQK